MWDNVKEFIDNNLILSIVIGAAALCLCLSCCIFLCCCCNFWRNNKKRKARHEQNLEMTHVNKESGNSNGAHTNPSSAPKGARTKPLAPPSRQLPALPLKSGMQSQGSLNNNTLDWANPDNYGKWTESQARLMTTENEIDDRNTDWQNNINASQDNIMRKEESDADE